MVVGSNPSPDHCLDLTPFNGLMTRRKGETVCSHYWFRRPSPHLPRKGARKGSKHSPEGAYDLMPWLVVLPGSVHPNGSHYGLYVMRDGLWVLWDARSIDQGKTTSISDTLGHKERSWKI